MRAVIASLAVSMCEGSCFVARTRVATPSGDRAIAELAVGDAVLCSDDVGVVKAIHRARGAIFAIITNRGEVLGVTATHPFFVGDAFVPVAELRVGDVLHHREGPATIVAIHPVAEGDTVEVFNLTVEGTPTYFADGFLVHNKSPAVDYGPRTTTGTTIVSTDDASRAQACPRLCGEASSTLIVDACSVGSTTTPPPRGRSGISPNSDACPRSEPADLTSCSAEGMTCVWPHSGDWCTESYGTCKAGQWRTSACGAASTIAPRAEICPTGRVALDAKPMCPIGVDQRCVWMTDNAFCPEVEAFCFNGEWKARWCRSGGAYITRTCTVTQQLQ
jgi:hypothetical protein